MLALPLVAVLALDADAAQMDYLTAMALAPNLLLALTAAPGSTGAGSDAGR